MFLFFTKVWVLARPNDGRSLHFQHFLCYKAVYISIGEIKRSSVNFVGLEKTVTELVTGCLRPMKSWHICIKERNKTRLTGPIFGNNLG